MAIDKFSAKIGPLHIDSSRPYTGEKIEYFKFVILILALAFSIFGIYYIDNKDNLRVVLFFVLGSCVSVLISKITSRDDFSTSENDEVKYFVGDLSQVIDLNPIKSDTPSVPWDLTPNFLIGKDNALALAKIRIDIERELRKLAHSNNIPMTTALFNIVRYFEKDGVFEPEISQALKETIRVCSEAIHGANISNDVADSVAENSTYIMEYLRNKNDKYSSTSS